MQEFHSNAHRHVIHTRQFSSRPVLLRQATLQASQHVHHRKKHDIFVFRSASFQSSEDGTFFFFFARIKSLIHERQSARTSSFLFLLNFPRSIAITDPKDAGKVTQILRSNLPCHVSQKAQAGGLHCHREKGSWQTVQLNSSFSFSQSLLVSSSRQVAVAMDSCIHRRVFRVLRSCVGGWRHSCECLGTFC